MRADVLILGAGPAGTALATHLSRRSYDVRIADRKDFPRHKPCGEFLSPACAPYLDELDVTARIAAVGPHRVRGMQLHGYDRRATGEFLQVGDRPDYARSGLAMRREQFDFELLQNARAAGASWLPRHQLQSLIRDPDGAVRGARLRNAAGESIDCRARWVIGADGVRSHVARELAVQRPIRWLDRMALVAHFRGVEPRPHAEVHLFPGGFFAATTVDDNLFSINLVVDRSVVQARTDADWDEFVGRHADLAPPFRERLRGSHRVSPWRGTGPLAYTTRQQTFRGAALVGDACGYIDPITGEGIYYALFGARQLAVALHDALADPGSSTRAMASYRRMRAREIGPRITASRWLQRGLRHAWLVRSFLAALTRWPTLADLVVTLTGDTVHPRELRSLSFWRSLKTASTG